jgi:hypothetical protein
MGEILYCLSDMRSCVVVELAATVLVSDTALKARWTDDFGIRDSKMLARMATDMLLVEILGLPDRFLSSVLSVPRRSPSDQRKFVLRSIFEFPNTSRYNSYFFYVSERPRKVSISMKDV